MSIAQPRRGSAPTISDVARHAGVSPMTVSRVINGESNVRAATRATVEAAIATLRYAPNPAARTLAGAGQKRIGLLYSNPSAAYLSEFLVGSLDQASRSHIQLIVEKCDLGEHEIEVARRLMASGIDGIVLPSPLCDSADLIRVMGEEGIPAVLVGSGHPSETLDAVSIDDFGASRAMMKHLLTLGHTRIGFITGNPQQSSGPLRLEGYRAALAEAGLEVDEALIAQGLFTYRSGLDAADTLLELADPPTAIFASNDDMAAATVAVAHRRSLDVPGDLTVCGFDDTTLATAIWPELTTIHQPIADMARVAVVLLLNTIRLRRDGMRAAHEVLDFTLIRRQSDAAPRRRSRVQRA